MGTPHEELIHALDNLRHLTAKDQLAKLTPEARGGLLSLLKQAAAVMGERTNAPSRQRLTAEFVDHRSSSEVATPLREIARFEQLVE